MSAAAEDLGPLVEAGGGGGEHDEVFLLQAQSAHSRCGVEAARPREAVSYTHLTLPTNREV